MSPALRKKIFMRDRGVYCAPGCGNSSFLEIHHLRYFVREGCELLAMLGFSAAAWAVAPRDRFIGWENSVCKERLRFVVNNSRFLILPWIHSKCLASRVLATATRRLSDDWWKRYNYRPALVETFVEKDRFAGTSKVFTSGSAQLPSNS